MPEIILLPSIASVKQQRIPTTKALNNCWTGRSEHRRLKRNCSESDDKSHRKLDEDTLCFVMFLRFGLAIAFGTSAESKIKFDSHQIWKENRVLGCHGESG